MKLCYFTIWREDSETVGINMKIRNQVKAFANLGCESYFCVSASQSVKLYYYNTDEKRFCVKNEIQFSKLADHTQAKGKARKLLSSSFRLRECLHFMDEMQRKNNFELIYIRRIIPFTGEVGRYIKRWSNSGTKIVWEIPTWGESFKTLKSKVLHAQEEFMYNRLKGKMQVVAISSGQPGNNDVLLINNGVDSETIPVRSLNKHDEINLICLATFSFWHGYDRLLKGLHTYCSSKHEKNVHVYMVGNGEVDSLKELAKSLGVSDKVHFMGTLVGDELNALFDKMDVAIGNLGFFRCGVTTDTSIKIREYCARGIPFVTALTVNDFPADFKYIMRVPMDESDIDINSIIECSQKLDARETITEMRQYAEKNLTWEKQLSKVLERVK